MNDWAQHALFYHIYPLGMCGAPWRNPLQAQPEARLESLYDWIPHLKKLGVNAIYLGPLWESSSHGYDTINYLEVDRRLGTAATLRQVIQAFHQAGMRVVLDAVFNHVGRDFFAFLSLQRQLKKSPYQHWFQNLRFEQRSPAGDPFAYEGWKGHYDLVKLNLQQPEVQQHLLEAVRYWIESFGIDGLRLDAADCMDKDFLQELKHFCQRLKPDFWLLGEVVMGDYREWGLDAITNYELYDSLHKAHNTRNYERLATTLERQFGSEGVYRQQGLYNFVDNHDVNRIASLLRRNSHLYPLYLLLFTLPGTPSLYYGSEAGLEGKRLRGTDRPLRPFLGDPEQLKTTRHPDLLTNIMRLSQLRQQTPALMQGSYRTLQVCPEWIVFERKLGDQTVVVLVNQSKEEQNCQLNLPGQWQDLLNDQKPVNLNTPVEIFASWGRVLLRQS